MGLDKELHDLVKAFDSFKNLPSQVSELASRVSQLESRLGPAETSATPAATTSEAQKTA